MHTQADKAADNKSQPVTGGSSQQTDGRFADNRAEAAAQLKLKDMANNSPQTRQLKAYQDMANTSPQVAQLKAYKDMVNGGSIQSKPLQSKIVQRTVVDGENKQLDVDAFMNTYMVPQYGACGVTAEETAAVTAEIKGKIASLFEPDGEGEDPTSLEEMRPGFKDGGMGWFNIRTARDTVRYKAEQERLAALPQAEAVVEPVVAEEPAAGGGADAPAHEEAPGAVAVAEAEPVRAPGNPNSLGTDMFESLGGGKYGSTTEVEADDVDALVNKSIENNVKLTVLTGTHGDSEGWLFGEEDFASSDTKALAPHGIIVQDVSGKSKSAIKALIDGATTPAVLLAWCFSKKSYDNWDNIHAVFSNKDAYMELNETLGELDEQAEGVKTEKDKYAEVVTKIRATVAAMLALRDW